MRIVAVSRSLPGHSISGGMEQIAHDLFNEWSRRGHEVTCVTTPGFRDHGQAYNVVTAPGRSARYSSKWRRALPGLVKGLQPDVVFSVSGGAHGPLVKNALAPVVMQAHGTSIDEIRTKLRSMRPLDWLKAAKNVLGLMGDLRSYRHYAVAVAVSDTVAESMKRFPKRFQAKMTRVIPNGVPLSANRSDRRDGPLKVLFVGRMKHEKGPDLLVGAASGSDWLVKIIGDGPELTSLRESAGENVEFTGKLSRESVLMELELANVLVAVSRRIEGLPLVVLEALAAGVPCVVSDSIAHSFGSSIPDGLVVVEPDFAEVRRGVAAAINMTTSLPPEFGIEVCAIRYEELFQKLVVGVD